MPEAFSDTLAEHIVHGARPMTALHVGCGRGSLVAALRQRGVRAWGIDESLDAGAIEPSVREYCTSAWPFDPLLRHFDLIVCLGALAHLPKLDDERAIANLCAHCEDVLFSSNDAELDQLKPSEYWAARFAQHGFFHDVFFDASFAGPNAMRFHKLRGSIADVVRNYELRHRQMTELVGRIEQGRFMRVMRRVHELRSRLKQGSRFAGAGEQVSSGAHPHPRPPTHPPTRTDNADYQVWIAANEPSAAEFERQRQHRFTYHPLISVITPVFNPPPRALRDAIESVLAQTYSGWELCLVDGGSDGQEVGKILEGYAHKDKRIRIRLLESNLGISGNSNEALRMATGDFVLLFDHDDLLAPFALHEVVCKLNEDPTLDVICFDEDKVSADGAMRLAPMFKPSRWSPELMLSANYLMHAAIRRSLVEQVGGFDLQTDGAQDWDLLLRCTEQTARIGHIPKVLYHWRMLPNSAATGGAASKPWAIEVQPRVVVNHLKRIGVADASAKLIAPGVFRLIWPVRDEKVSIIIPTVDNAELLRRCVRSLLTLTAYADFEVILIDTGSTDRRARDYYAELVDEQRVRMLHGRVLHDNKAFNYSAVNNFGARHATGAHLLFLNDDVEALEPGWLEEMLRWSQRPEIGAVGAKLLYPEGAIQHAGIVIGMGHIFANAPEDFTSSLFGGPGWYRNYAAVTGACMMVRRDVFDQVGGFNEDYELAFSDIELCLRVVEKGYRIVYTPFARLRHQEGATRANFVPDEDHALASRHLRAIIEEGDPFFNPNLSLRSPFQNCSHQPILLLHSTQHRQMNSTNE